MQGRLLSACIRTLHSSHPQWFVNVQCQQWEASQGAAMTTALASWKLLSPAWHFENPSRTTLLNLPSPYFIQCQSIFLAFPLLTLIISILGLLAIRLFSPFDGGTIISQSPLCVRCWINLQPLLKKHKAASHSKAVVRKQNVNKIYENNISPFPTKPSRECFQSPKLEKMLMLSTKKIVSLPSRKAEM